MHIRAGGIDEDKYSRLKLFEWYDVERVKRQKVMVVGAGALGNEVCKNLVLSGYRRLTIVDMDRIVKSNLNRCVFFSDEDAERQRYKAEVIAEKIKEMEKEVEVEYYTKRIEEFSEDFIRKHDLVMGCIDNVAARLHINASCYALRIPYIDGATHGQVGKVQVVMPPETSCLECGMNATHAKIMQKSFSCTGKDIHYFEPKIAADINTTSIIAAIQVQEALKITHERDNYIRNVFYFDGSRNFFSTLDLPINPRCPNHASL
jgi:molybdopterin/thiamine biosynthesis adenylyltransferase